MFHKDFLYVNRMTNVAYLTGMVKADPHNANRFFLAQTANEGHDLPIYLPSEEARVKNVGRMQTVVCHVRGEVTDTGSTCYLEMVSSSAPSVLTVNPLSSYLSGFAKRLPRDKIPEYLPYNRDGSLKSEFMKELRAIEDLKPEERAILDLYEATASKMRGRFDSVSNVVMVAGFIDSCAHYSANQHQSHGFVQMMLRQHADKDSMLPVRLVSKRSDQIVSKIPIGSPAMIHGRMRVKIVPTADGQGIASSALWIETDDIKATDQTSILMPLPAWMAEYKREKKAPVTPALLQASPSTAAA